LKHAGSKNNTKVDIEWIDSKEFEDNENPEIIDKLKSFQGILIPGGFGSSGVEGKINAIKYARENNIPYLGLCLGLQLAVVEFSRNVCNLKDAHSTEIDCQTQNPVIDILEEQKAITEKGATMRLGAYDAMLKLDSKVYNLYNSPNISERHRHRYEVNPNYHKILEDAGMVFSGISPDRKLVEFIELPNHKFFVATQAHPEFKSSLLKPAPLFDGFVKACLELK
jgi:CTP synthase